MSAYENIMGDAFVQIRSTCDLCAGALSTDSTLECRRPTGCNKVLNE